MNEKKNRDYSLERFRAPLLFLGVFFASAFVLTAFEWKTYSEISIIERTGCPMLDLPDEVIFAAPPLQKPPPPPPRPVIDDFQLTNIDKIMHIDFDMPDIDFKAEPVIADISRKAEKVTEEIIELPFVDVWPSFPGGDTARVKYLAESTRYPSKAVYSGTQGTVWVEFVINKKGEIEDAQVIKGIGAGCDEEALRVVNEMPKWNPGKQRGQPVKVRFRLPIKYTLRN